MRHYPKTKDEKEEAQALNAEPWQIAALKLNPEYVFWGPHEDYMYNTEGWTARHIAKTWGEFGPWGLDDYNEVVYFYFTVERDAKRCEDCDGSGYNPETKKIADAFYAHEGGGERWCNKITQDEVEALQAAGRLRVPVEGKWEKKEGLTAEEVNTANTIGGLSNYSHDSINRWILIETRAKRLGVWGKCPACGGNGNIFTAPRARLGLVLWFLHPRKGCSRGVEIENIGRSEIPAVLKYLTEAAKRNAKRFEKAMAASRRKSK